MVEVAPPHRVHPQSLGRSPSPGPPLVPWGPQVGEVTLLGGVTRPFPIVLVKCWKVAHWNAKKLLKNCQKSKKLLPKFQKLPPKLLDIFT